MAMSDRGKTSYSDKGRNIMQTSNDKPPFNMPKNT